MKGPQQCFNCQKFGHHDDAISDVLKDDNHELFDDYMKNWLPGHEEAVLSNGLRTWMIMWHKYVLLNLN